MKGKKFFKLPTFLSLLVLVVLTQILLLKPIIGQGFTHEDYVGFFKVRLYGNQFFTDPLNTWTKIGLHDAAHDFYIASLDKLFGENYTYILYTNIFFKILATLLLYPLILLITKNKLLAVLTTLLYAISYPSAGALYLYVVGNEYVGVMFLNLFLISYYFCVKKTTYRILLLTFLMITLCFVSSSIRIFPVFILILIFELTLLIKHRLSKPSSLSNLSNLKTSIFRVTAIFLPPVFITLTSLGTHGGDVYNLAGFPEFLKLITNGNWYLLLNPIWGLGYLFLPAPYFSFFGKINISYFIGFIFSWFHLIMLSLGLWLSFVLSNKPFRFFSFFMVIDLILALISFLLLTHHLNLAPQLIHEYNQITFLLGQSSTLIAVFVFSISISCLIEWFLTNRKDLVYLSAFLAPFLSLLFIVYQWIFTRQYFLYQEGLHRYLVIPQIGASLFLASLMTIAYAKTKSRLPIFFGFIIFILFLGLISRSEIARVFDTKRNAGADLQAQELMKKQTLNYIPHERITNNILFYIKLSGGSKSLSPWEEAFDWRSLTYWMQIKRSYLSNKITNGCIAMTWDDKELQKMAVIWENSKVFWYENGGNKEMVCIGENAQYFNFDNFYAFTIDQTKLKNITEDVNKNLIFKETIQ